MEARIAECIALGLVLLSVFDGAYKGLVLKIYSMVRFVLLLIVTMILVPLIMPLLPPDVTGGDCFFSGSGSFRSGAFDRGKVVKNSRPCPGNQYSK